MPRLLNLIANLFPLRVTLARLFRFDKIVCRTISIEVGMQNSGLATALATKHFPALPLAAVPCAISAIMHSVIGSALATYWRLRPAYSPAASLLSNQNQN